MIKVNYRARMGNNLFQYCLGRILAEELGYQLVAIPIPGFPNTKNKVTGAKYRANPLVLKKHEIDFKKLIKTKPKRKIVLEGFFQNYNYYKAHREQIKKWLETPQFKTRPGKDDIVIGIRRTDFIRSGSTLPMSYYEQAAKNFKNIWITTEDPNDPFIRKLKRRIGAKIYHKSALEDFSFMKNANNICISQSTFHWWAAFLSDAQKIFFPQPLTGYWSKKREDINLEVTDDDRYIIVPVTEKYVLSKEEEEYFDKMDFRKINSQKFSYDYLKNTLIKVIHRLKN